MIFTALKPAHRTALFNHEALRRIFRFTPISHDEVMKDLWKHHVNNVLLQTITSCCTLGLFYCRAECWRPTRLGYMISMLPSVDPVEMVKSFPFTKKEVEDSITWASEVIFDPKNRKILDKFVEKIEWYPGYLEELGQRESVLRVLAALTARQMAWFNGYTFDPTLFGCWFIVSPKSPLNKK